MRNTISQPFFDVKKGIHIMKTNCWEFKKCGREPNGVNVNELGVCPSATEKSLDGVHGGVNAGRTCWAVAGTMCGGKVQGTFARKYNSCIIKCDFYKTVKKEEGVDYEVSITLLNMIRKGREATYV